MSKLVFLVTIFLSFTLLLLSQSPLPNYYHRYEQMKAIMDSLAFEFPDKIMIENLGHSDTEQIPIWGAKLSVNAHTRRDRPRILLIGGIHAEEVIGNEICLKFMKEMVRKSNQEPYQTWLNELETWIVPSMNPEGLSLVTSGMDNTYRKNKKITDDSPEFSYMMGIGNDRHGIDLNRNWDINWVHGDTLFSLNNFNELYDYYRGAYPFSEGENRAIRDLAYREQFTYSIIWHSSRSGNLSEKVYIPYNFQGIRLAPDWDVNYQVGAGVASKIMRASGQNHYEALPAIGRKGDQHVWFYSKLGTIMFLIETEGVGDGIHPDQNTLNSIVNQCINGVHWLYNRASLSGYQLHNPRIPKSMLGLKITDASTGQPLAAEVIIHGKESEAISPRIANTEGRYWRPLINGLYSYSVQKKGYQKYTRTNVIISESSWTLETVELIPLEPITIHFQIKSNGIPVSSTIDISGLDGSDHLELPTGELVFNTYVGTKILEIIPDYGVPYKQEIVFSNSVELTFDVGSSTTLFADNFNDHLEQWEIEGPWTIITQDDKTFLADSWDGGNNFYAVDCDVCITTKTRIFIPDNQKTFLVFEQNLYTEWEYDFVTVEVSQDLINWVIMYQKAGKYDWWHKVLVDLSPLSGQNLYFKLRLQDKSDGNEELVDPGWMIDNLQILSGNVVSQIEHDLGAPKVGLLSNYPNPFNPETRITFKIDKTSVNNAQINIFNIKGQKIISIPLKEKELNNSYLIWKPENLATGIYFYQLNVDGVNYPIKKAILLK